MLALRSQQEGQRPFSIPLTCTAQVGALALALSPGGPWALVLGSPNIAAGLRAFRGCSQLRRPSPWLAASSSFHALLPFSLRSAGVEQLMYIKEDLIIPHVSLLSPQALGRVALGGARGFGVPGGFSGQSPLCSGSLARAGVAPCAERGLRPACGPAGGWERPRRVISHGFSVPGSSTTASTISSSPRHGGRVVSAPGPASPFPGHLAAARGWNGCLSLAGPLFNFDVHDDVRLLSDATVEKDEVQRCRGAGPREGGAVAGGTSGEAGRPGGPEPQGPAVLP